MRKFTFILVLAMTVCLSACLGRQEDSGGIEITGEDQVGIGSSDVKLVVCTTFPQYDWVREIAGSEDIELVLLLDNKVDLHSYQPTAEDMAKIASCDLFIHVGGESDKWVDEALESLPNKDRRVINLIEVLGASVKLEEFEGIEDGHGHEDESDHEDEPDHESEDGFEHEIDEHVWLSLRNAKLFCEVIIEELSALHPNKASVYQTNLKRYLGELDALDNEYEEVFEKASIDVLLFADRFPFRYFVDDYGLGYYAAFAGCSAETEASFDTIIFLAKKIDELGLNTIFVTESSDQAIARTVRDMTKDKSQYIVVLDSMQSAFTGDSYLSIMENNLKTLSLGGQD